MNRREFITTVAKGAIAAGLGLVAIEASYLFSYFGPTEGFMPDWKGDLPELDADGLILFKGEPVSVVEILDVIAKTGSFLFLFPGVFHGRNETLPGIVSRDAQGNLYASSRKCTHEGCLVTFRDDIVLGSKSYQKVWLCRCHDGLFNAQRDGEVLAGPPPTRLPQFDIEFVDEGEKVRLVSR
ncbi:MAG: Rieske 2Fe-2S domain-containing protein [Candidatus Thermoplasmatota archaeon]|nr:Rieske 2Fe-2S domain-containing protein [Candidatus Thermoplasmatota archaeon]